MDLVILFFVHYEQHVINTCIDIRKEMQRTGEIGSSSRRLENWTVDRDGALLDFLHVQHQEGRRVGKTFTKDGWRAVVKLWKDKFHSELTIPQYKNRWKLLVEKYRLYRDLKEKSGWGWDNVDNKPIAPDDEIWDDVIGVCKYSFAFLSISLFSMYIL